MKEAPGSPSPQYARIRVVNSSTVFDYLIIGTGPSAVAAAMALRRIGAAFEVVDVGFDLEPERESRVKELARQEPAGWSDEDRNILFPPPKTSSAGVEKRFSFGSDFPYRVAEPLELRTEDCVVDVTHGFGGFGNVWGAAILPFVENDLVDWPIRVADLMPSYRNIAGYVPMSGVADDLERFFPRFDEDGRGLMASRQVQGLAQACRRLKASLQESGIWVGRSRVAVDSSGGPSTCRYCGHCLDGCPYGSIFNPRHLWIQLERQGVVVRRGLYALEFQEQGDRVDTVLLDLKSGTIHQVSARRVFLGMGTINSTRMVARSLRLQKRIRLKDSQYFFFPFLSYRKTPDAPMFTLAELFVEILNPRLGPYFTHFQVYGLNSIFQQAIRALVPPFLRRPLILDQIEKRFFLFQGFLHSELSGGLEFTLEAIEDRRDRVRIRGVENPESLQVARGAQRMLRNKLMSYGIIPPLYLKMVPLGRSFHVGGSFPMGGRDPVLRSDRQGRPAQLSRVHLLDAATFPSIPATTITFTIMANADRIIRETLGQPT